MFIINVIYSYLDDMPYQVNQIHYYETIFKKHLNFLTELELSIILIHLPKQGL